MKNNIVDDDDFIIDDLLKNSEKKKKINSGRKGKSGERGVVKILNNRFESYLKQNPKAGSFSRSVGSGNRWSQTSVLPKHAQDTFTGDLVCPEGFKFVLECKTGYNDVDLFTCFGEKCTELDVFIGQVKNDSIRAEKIPMLIWKKDRKEHVAFLSIKDIDCDQCVKDCFNKKIQSLLFYKDWIGLNLDYILSFEDSFFFN